MEREIAERLVNELGNHSRIISPDKKLFLDVLVSTDIQESSRFHEVLQDKQQLAEESDSYYSLSLRRILRNSNAKRYKLSQWKKAYESFISTFSFYSSDSLSRNLRADKGIIEMMAECKEPFSLLGKFKTYDFDNSEETLFVVTRPVLVIPGVRDTNRIYGWEEANTIYEKEVGIFRNLKKIKPHEYFSYDKFN